MTTPLIGVFSLLMAAAPGPAPEVARTAVRADGIVQGFDFTGAGMEVAHSFDDEHSLEASIAGLDLSRGYQALYGQMLARLGMTSGRHGVNVGIGPGLLSSPNFGRVWFAVPEAAYEYRQQNGFSLAVGVGLPVTLNDSRAVPCAESGSFACFLERTQFHGGDVMPRVRLALGYSF
jgi:hypothetical protein